MIGCQVARYVTCTSSGVHVQPAAWPRSQVFAVSGLGTRLMSCLKHGLISKHSVLTKHLGASVACGVCFDCWYPQHLLNLLFEILDGL